MTREEAIEILNHNVSACLHGTEWGEALNMAIKALEQEPCEDAISRSDAIRVASGYCHWSNIPTELAKLPSVSTEETGHWSRKIKVDAYDLYGVKTWGIKCQCDRCTFTTTVVEDFGYYKYCPNCGAKMIKPQESENCN